MSMQEIEWTAPGSTNRTSAKEGPGKSPTGGHKNNGGNPSSPVCSREALLALQYATLAAQDFDSTFALAKQQQRSKKQQQQPIVPTFHGDEIVMKSKPLRRQGTTVEFEVTGIRLVMDLMQDGAFSNPMLRDARQRLAERCAPYYDQQQDDSSSSYNIKFVQPGLIETEWGPPAATDIMYETKILLHLSAHPHIVQLVGMNTAGIDSLVLSSGRHSYFIMTHGIQELLTERIESWRRHPPETSPPNTTTTPLWMTRLELALDIASAMVYIHDRQLVMFLRPDKVGFDSEQGRIQLCQFGQARQQGTTSYSQSLLRSDNVSGVLAYTAPEVFCRVPMTPLSDVYAFGILLWEMLTLDRPFEGYDRALHFEKVVMKEGKSLAKAQDFSDSRPNLDRLRQVASAAEQDSLRAEALSKLISKCWHPHHRPTMKVVHETLVQILLFDPTHQQDLLRNSSGASLPPSVTNTQSDTTSASSDPTVPQKTGSDRGRRGSKVITEGYDHRQVEYPFEVSPGSPVKNEKIRMGAEGHAPWHSPVRSYHASPAKTSPTKSIQSRSTASTHLTPDSGTPMDPSKKRLTREGILQRQNSLRSQGSGKISSWRDMDRSVTSTGLAAVSPASSANSPSARQLLRQNSLTSPAVAGRSPSDSRRMSRQPSLRDVVAAGEPQNEYSIPARSSSGQHRPPPRRRNSTHRRHSSVAIREDEGTLLQMQRAIVQARARCHDDEKSNEEEVKSIDTPPTAPDMSSSSGSLSSTPKFERRNSNRLISPSPEPVNSMPAPTPKLERSDSSRHICPSKHSPRRQSRVASSGATEAMPMMLTRQTSRRGNRLQSRRNSNSYVAGDDNIGPEVSARQGKERRPSLSAVHSTSAPMRRVAPLKRYSSDRLLQCRDTDEGGRPLEDERPAPDHEKEIKGFVARLRAKQENVSTNRTATFLGRPGSRRSSM